MWTLSSIEQKLQATFHIRTIQKKKDAKVGNALSHDPDSWKSTVFVEGSKACLFVLLIRVVVRWRRVRSVGGMVLTGETAVLGQKPVSLPLYRPQMSHGLTWDWIWAQRLNLIYIIKKATDRASQRTRCASITYTKRLMLGKWWLFT